MEFEAVIGLEVHAELQTKTKMFCACPVVDLTQAPPNSAVCPVCSGMPGALPVINKQAVEFALRVALALDCRIETTSIFARKNYFYPDLPKGYQISQYEHPLAQFGHLNIKTESGEKKIRIQRVHMEEDTGKLTHVINADQTAFSLVDLNRAGVSLLEIVSEPDMNSAEEAGAYAMALREIIRELGVNSGDMEKGVIRFEANVSIRPRGQTNLGTRVEIKNLNTFRGMEKAIRFEVLRQTALVEAGLAVVQETLGWDETAEETTTQRSKEEAHDYRYFPEPDLPPLVVDPTWVALIKSNLPELPQARFKRMHAAYKLGPEETSLLAEDLQISVYFEQTLAADPSLSPKLLANWITGPLFAWQNYSGETFSQIKVQPKELAQLLKYVTNAEINQTTAKIVLEEMLINGEPAAKIIAKHGFQQLRDSAQINSLIRIVLSENPKAVSDFVSGKESLINWFFGQVMLKTRNQVDPAILRAALKDELDLFRQK